MMNQYSITQSDGRHRVYLHAAPIVHPANLHANAIGAAIHSEQLKQKFKPDFELTPFFLGMRPTHVDEKK